MKPSKKTKKDEDEEMKDESEKKIEEKKLLAEAVASKFIALDLCQYQDHQLSVPPNCKLKSFKFEDRSKVLDCGYEPGILVQIQKVKNIGMPQKNQEDCEDSDEEQQVSKADKFENKYLESTE